MNDILLSIIIPAYNAEKYIVDCLKSLHGLMADTLEVIVINDGSKDSTVSKVKDYVNIDNRIRLITVENGGVSKARNIGLSKATGKYIMFLDADDYLLSSTFKVLENEVFSDEYDFVAFARDIINADGKKWHQGFCFEGEKTTEKDISDRIMFADSLFNECWGKLYRKSIVDEYGIKFSEGVPVGEDLMFVMQYYSYCKKVCVYNDSLVGYRQHAGSAMRKYSVSDRLKYTCDLYEYSKRFIPSELYRESVFYYFKVLTNICREYSKDEVSRTVIKSIYSSDMTSEIIGDLEVGNVPFYRWHEYILMRCKLYILSAMYYHAKARV